MIYIMNDIKCVCGIKNYKTTPPEESQIEIQAEACRGCACVQTDCAIKTEYIRTHSLFSIGYFNILDR